MCTIASQTEVQVPGPVLGEFDEYADGEAYWNPVLEPQPEEDSSGGLENSPPAV